MTKMGSIIGHRIDYNGVGALRGQRHIPSKNWPKCPPRANTVLFNVRHHIGVVSASYQYIWWEIEGEDGDDDDDEWLHVQLKSQGISCTEIWESDLGKNSLKYLGPILWSIFRPDIRSLPSLDALSHKELSGSTSPFRSDTCKNCKLCCSWILCKCMYIIFCLI